MLYGTSRALQLTLRVAETRSQSWRFPTGHLNDAFLCRSTRRGARIRRLSPQLLRCSRNSAACRHGLRITDSVRVAGWQQHARVVRLSTRCLPTARAECIVGTPVSCKLDHVFTHDDHSEDVGAGAAAKAKRCIVGSRAMSKSRFSASVGFMHERQLCDFVGRLTDCLIQDQNSVSTVKFRACTEHIVMGRSCKQWWAFE